MLTSENSDCRFYCASRTRHRRRRRRRLQRRVSTQTQKQRNKFSSLHVSGYLWFKLITKSFIMRFSRDVNRIGNWLSKQNKKTKWKRKINARKTLFVWKLFVITQMKSFAQCFCSRFLSTVVLNKYSTMRSFANGTRELNSLWVSARNDDKFQQKFTKCKTMSHAWNV